MVKGKNILMTSSFGDKLYHIELYPVFFSIRQTNDKI